MNDTVWIAYAVVGTYAVLMLGVVWLFTTRGHQTRNNYYVADRRLPFWRAVMSVAVSWVWAPGIFFAATKAYTQGVPGAFWFIAPNLVCCAIFGFVAARIRRDYPNTLSLADYFRSRFSNDQGTHLSSLLVVAIIDIVALLFNTFIGAFLLSLISGIPVSTGMILMMSVALLYSAWRGLPSSVVTDVVQLVLIFAIAFVLVPWSYIESGGWSTFAGGLGGVTGEYRDLWNFSVFYTFGIASSLALIAVPMADQMFYQRAMACKKNQVLPVFVVAGLVSSLVPIVLCVFGFIAASPASQEAFAGQEFPPILVNYQVVKTYLPQWTLFGFTIMAICALSSTVDSALCALGSLWGQDVYGRYINPKASDEQNLKHTRYAVVAFGLLALGVAIVLKSQLSGDVLFHFNGVIASVVVPPLLLAVFWKRTNALAVVVGILATLLVFAPFAWYVNVQAHVVGTPGMIDFVVAAAVGAPLVSFMLTLAISSLRKPTLATAA
jgi:urea-proton symporter